MAIEITRSPVLKGKSAEEFEAMLKKNSNKPLIDLSELKKKKEMVEAILAKSDS